MSEEIVVPEVVEEKKENTLNTEQKKVLEAVQAQIITALDTTFVEEISKNNVCEFKYKDVLYRVIRPNYQQKQEIYKERVKKFNELLRDKTYILEKDLKKSYLERDVDVDSLGTKIRQLELKKNGVQVKLGELLKNGAPDDDCKTLKTDIEDIEQEQRALAIEKQSLLEFSLENQVLLHMYNYMTYIITEKKDDKGAGIWEKAFSSFEKFMQTDEELVTKLAFLITITNRDLL